MNWTKKILKIEGSIVVLILIIFLTSSCKQTANNIGDISALPFYNQASFTPNWMSKDDDSMRTIHKIPSFSLTNQEGETITDQSLNGKIYVADFFFTICPGICPKMTANMGILQEEFMEDPDIMLLSHSVTPVRDSVPVLKAYAEKKGVLSDRWHLLTGDRQEIYTLGRKAYFIEEDLGIERDIDEFLHTENFVLIDKNKHIRGIYNGLNKTSIKQLIKDVRTLQKEEKA